VQQHSQDVVIVLTIHRSKNSDLLTGEQSDEGSVAKCATRV
jgi:hypothetical protein